MAADPVTEAHITAQQRLREIAAAGVTAAWLGLDGYDEEDVAPFLAVVLPLMRAVQRRSVVLSAAYVARVLRRPPLALNVDDVIAQVRAGVGEREEWRRPFVTTWTALGAHTPWEQATSHGLARARSAAVTDVQLAHRGALQAAQDVDSSIRGYRRAADASACSFCRLVDGAFVKSASAAPLHPGCGCGFEPVLVDRPVTPLPDGVAVHTHGELGPTLGDPRHSFTSLV